jgi:hypothetical protein
MAEARILFADRKGACPCDRGFMNAVPLMRSTRMVDAAYRVTAAVQAAEASMAAAERCLTETVVGGCC